MVTPSEDFPNVLSHIAQALFKLIYSSGRVPNLSPYFSNTLVSYRFRIKERACSCHLLRFSQSGLPGLPYLMSLEISSHVPLNGSCVR